MANAWSRLAVDHPFLGSIIILHNFTTYYTIFSVLGVCYQYAVLLSSSEAYQGEGSIALISSFGISDCPWTGCTWMHLGSVAVRLRMRGKALQMQQLWFQTSWACRHKTSCRLPAPHGSSWIYEDLRLHTPHSPHSQCDTLNFKLC